MHNIYNSNMPSISPAIHKAPESFTISLNPKDFNHKFIIKTKNPIIKNPTNANNLLLNTKYNKHFEL